MKDKILEYYDSDMEYRDQWLMREKGLLNLREVHVNNYAKSDLEKDLRKLGLGNLKDAVNLGKDGRDERIKKTVALLMYEDEAVTDPIERDYRYEELKKEVDGDLDKEVENKIFEWKKEIVSERLEDTVENSKEEWKKGNKLRENPLEDQSLKQKVQAMIGYNLFWRDEAKKEERGRIDPKFTEQLKKGETDIYMRKAMKDAGVTVEKDVGITKIDEDEWVLDGAPRSHSRMSYIIKKDEEGLRVISKTRPLKNDVSKNLTVVAPSEISSDLEFLKDFEKWGEKGSWWEEDGSVNVNIDFKDCSERSEVSNREYKVKKFLSMYDMVFMDKSLEIKFG